MRIAVCDDNMDEPSQISSLLDEYRLARKTPISRRLYPKAREAYVELAFCKEVE